MKTLADFGIEAYGSGEVRTICPQCSHTRKKKRDRCLAVNVEDGVWSCHHCGWSGSLGRKAEIVEYKPKVYRKPDPKPVTDLPRKVVDWFAERGISEGVLLRNKIRAGVEWMPQVQGETGVVSFPYFRDGEIINYKHRTRDKAFRMEAGAERILYGYDDIGKVLVIVEGEMDKLAVEEAFTESCVSVPDGAPSPNTQGYSTKFEFLDSAADVLAGVDEFILAVDNDAPGRRLHDELVRRLGAEKCRAVEWPEGCKDANDVLVNHSKGRLAEVLANAKFVPVAGAVGVDDHADAITDLYENGWEKGHSTGWPSVDQIYTVRPGELTILTGIPNSGKSNFMDALMVNLAKQHGWRFAICSPENLPLSDHMSRVIEKWSGMPFGEGPHERMSRAMLEKGKAWAQDHITWILPDDESDWTIENILEIARQLVFRRGIQGLVIDPWNELEHMRPGTMSETEYVSHVLKRVKVFARKHKVHVWIVAHPAKLYKDKDGNYPVPSPYDISGSAHWRNKADCCLTIWRDFNATHRMIELHVQKIRFRQIGRVGMCDLAFNHVTHTYHEQAKANDEIPPDYGF